MKTIQQITNELFHSTLTFDNDVAWTQAQIELLLCGVILFKNPSIDGSHTICIIILNDKFDITNKDSYLPKRPFIPNNLLHLASQVLIAKTFDSTDVYVWKDRFDFDRIYLGKIVPRTKFTHPR